MPVSNNVVILFSKLSLLQLEPIAVLGIVTLVVGVPAVAYCWLKHEKV